MPASKSCLAEIRLTGEVLGRIYTLRSPRGPDILCYEYLTIALWASRDILGGPVKRPEERRTPSERDCERLQTRNAYVVPSQTTRAPATITSKKGCVPKRTV
jgi:hypothetical protein